MGKKIVKKKKVAKVDPNADEKVYLANIIKNMDRLAEELKGQTLGPYFANIALVNRNRLKELK